jgi:hypothetical protein
MSFRQPDIQAPNALAQFAQIQQIQGGQQAQELNRLQLQEYQRSREEEEATRNFLRGRDLAAPETRTGLAQFGKTGLAYSKLLQDQEAAALNARNVQSQISERDFGLQDKKLKFAWNAVGSASTPDAAIAELTKGVKDGVFDMKAVTAEIQQLQNMSPEQYQQYRVQKVMGILDAKDKLGFMLPKVARQDIGGSIVNIQDNPALPGYGLPVQGAAPMAKTKTFADITAEKNLGVSQGQLGLAREKFKFDQTTAGQSVTYQQDANGNIVALPTKVKPGDIPRGRTVAAPGAGMSPMAGKPSEAAAKETASLAQQNAIVKGALEEIKKNPGAFGTARGLAGGVLGETFGARVVGETPEETQARSFLFNVVSGVIKERAGTAQSAGEQATLDRFLPTTTDNADELTSKLKGFQDYLKARESASKKPGRFTPPARGVDTSNPLLNLN